MIIPSKLLSPEIQPKSAVIQNLVEISVRAKSRHYSGDWQANGLFYPGHDELTGGVEIIGKLVNPNIDSTLLGRSVSSSLSPGWTTRQLQKRIHYVVMTLYQEQPRLLKITELMNFVDTNFTSEQATALVEKHPELTDEYEEMTLDQAQQWMSIFKRSFSARNRKPKIIRTLFNPR